LKKRLYSNINTNDKNTNNTNTTDATTATTPTIKIYQYLHILFLLVSGEDTKMKFSVSPSPGESGFEQWHSAMKMVARLAGGIPQEFRKTVSTQ
jgi:hypothetical protein